MSRSDQRHRAEAFAGIQLPLLYSSAAMKPRKSMCFRLHSFKMAQPHPAAFLNDSEHSLSPLRGEQVIRIGYNVSCEATEIGGLLITMA